MSGPERGMAAEDGEDDPAAAGRRAGKPLRDIAVDLYGRERVGADWHADSATRSKMRRLVRRSLDEAPGSGDGARARGRR